VKSIRYEYGVCFFLGGKYSYDDIEEELSCRLFLSPRTEREWEEDSGKNGMDLFFQPLKSYDSSYQ